MKTLKVSEWAECAILKILGLPLVARRVNTQTSRVEFEFEDAEGRGEKALADHNLGNLRIPSLDFVLAEKWIKRLTHETRSEQNNGDNRYRGASFNGIHRS